MYVYVYIHVYTCLICILHVIRTKVLRAGPDPPRDAPRRVALRLGPRRGGEDGRGDGVALRLRRDDGLPDPGVRSAGRGFHGKTRGAGRELVREHRRLPAAAAAAPSVGGPSELRSCWLTAGGAALRGIGQT